MLVRDSLVGRQPIFNHQLQVFGYELLYRNCERANSAVVLDKDQATTEVILNAFTSIGIENIVGDTKAFINFTRNFLLEKNPIPLPPERVVLEVTEDTLIDDNILEALRDLSQRGFTIALDDVIDPNDVLPLLDLAHIVKLELPSLSRQQISSYTSFYKKRGLKIVAEKVETQAEFEFCRKLGIEYFQGYFLCKPNIIKGRQLKPNVLTRLRLMQKIQDPYVNFKDIEEIVAQDVALSYRILRLVNSAMYGLRHEVESLPQAIALLGLEQTRKWFTLSFMMELGEKPPELLSIGLIRAQMCELLARGLHRPKPETYFLIGLLSVLDAFMDIPIEEVIASFSLSETVQAALLSHTGPTGEILSAVMAYEEGRWEDLKLELSPQTIRDAYIKSIQWAKTITSEIAA